MALEEIRQNKSGKGIYIIIGLLLLGMIGFGTSEFGLNRETRQNFVIEVGDAKITESLYRQQVARIQQTFPEMPLNEVEQLSQENLKRQAVLEDFINRYPLLPDAQAVDQAIVSNPNFQLGGEFDQETMSRIVQGQFRMPLGEYRHNLAKEMGVDNFQRAIVDSSVVSQSEITAFSLLGNTERDVLVAKIAGDLVSNEASEEEISAYYDENKANYLSDYEVAIEYVEINPETIKAEIEVTEEEIVAANTGLRSATYYLFADEASAQSAYEQLSSGADIATVSEAFAEQLEDTGDLGTINPQVGLDDIVPQSIADALYALESVGEFSPPIVTDLGIYLVELSDMAETQPLAQVRDKIVNDIRSERAESIIADLQDKLNVAFFEASSPTLDSIAEETGLTKTSEALTQLSSRQGILATPEVVEAIQLSDKSTNTLHEPVEIGDRIIVYQLTEVIEPEQLGLDEVKETIRETIIAEKNSEELKSMAEALQAMTIEKGLEAAATEKSYPTQLIENFNAQTTQDDFVDVIAKFLIAQNPPLLGNENAEMVESPTDDFYVYVNEAVRFNAPDDPEQQASLSENLSEQLGASQLNSLIESLTSRADIKDRTASLQNNTNQP